VSTHLPALKKLPRSFYLRATLTVAKDLLGKYLVRRIGRERLVGKIVEVEAYLGENDPASHAYRGRTKRNDVMFWKGGHLYMYFTYGMHFCCNVVTEEEGRGRAVLIRAVEPVEGIEAMVKNRGFTRQKEGGHAGDEPDHWDYTNVANGPAKLCKAFGIGRKENGTDLCGDETWIGEVVNAKPQTKNPKRVVLSSSRIGIQEGREREWRFYLKGSRFVSRA
jgi:DNA-3-methyladenine glycosylase